MLSLVNAAKLSSSASVLDTSFDSILSETSSSSSDSHSNCLREIHATRIYEVSRYSSTDDDSSEADVFDDESSDDSEPDTESVGHSIVESSHGDVILVDSDDSSCIEYVGDGESDQDEGEPVSWLFEARADPDLGLKRSTCVECGRDVVGLSYHHCRKCWKKWRSFYSDGFSMKLRRPTTLKRVFQEVESSDSDASSSNKSARLNDSKSSSQSSVESISDIVPGNSSKIPEKCLMCQEAPSEMSIEHPKVLHQCVCRKCARAIKCLPKDLQKCPFCGRRFTGITKVF
ncbi:unnamed protein product [Notodromas monacha]|uniref:Uncharacterized protein n=1 Tax=Notodromas monacha TaxID=399045 RepID=A0A7R9BKX7_9CRUS|nr:unnamed protein product [Notodromas monacha]CAG0916595.1 unnamed protein product [Notodromas monacha]